MQNLQRNFTIGIYFSYLLLMCLLDGAYQKMDCTYHFAPVNLHDSQFQHDSSEYS
jgi:hypothetical protein